MATFHETPRDLEMSGDHDAFNAPCASLPCECEVSDQGLTLPQGVTAEPFVATQNKKTASKAVWSRRLPSSCSALRIHVLSQALKGNPSLLYPPEISLIMDLGTCLTNARHPKLRAHSIGDPYLPRTLDNPEGAQIQYGGMPGVRTPDKITH